MFALKYQPSKGLAFIVILLSSLWLTACGGSSSSSNDGDKGGDGAPLTLGQEGSNDCLLENTNEVNLACYLVPGSPGDEPELVYASYTRQQGKFKLDTGASNGEKTFSWHDINENSAQYDENGETTYFDWDEAEGTITQTYDKGAIDEDQLTRPLTPLIGNVETVTDVSEGETLEGKLKVFEPKKRTVIVPGTNHSVEANNAIMLVQISEAATDGSGLVSVQYSAPGAGHVALITYMHCQSVNDLDFRDDLNYYETQCASNFDWAWIRKDKSSSNGGGAGGPSVPGGSGTGSIGQQIKDKLGSGAYSVYVAISSLDESKPAPDVIFSGNIANVGLPVSENEFCTNFEAFTRDAHGNYTSGSEDSCNYAEIPELGSSSLRATGAVESEQGIGSYQWFAQ